MTGRDIICLSTHYWDDRRFRKQEFMSRFAASNRVLFVEPSFSMVRRPEAHHRTIATNRPLVSRLEEREAGLRLLKPPQGIPKWTDPRVEKATYRWYGRTIAKAAKRLGFRDAVLWVYQPSYIHALDAIPHRHLVFDLVDDLAAYRSARAEIVESQVRALVKRSDLLVVTARTLLDRYESIARRIVQVSNGFDPSLFAPERIAAEPPAVLHGLPRPILGFVGTIFDLLDFELLRQVARSHRDKSLVLVGPVEATAAAAAAPLMAEPNVFHLGPQPQSAIPSFVAAFDVCLSPFATGPLADSVSPLKVYEYLAMGRPVVSVPMKSLEAESAGRVIAFGEGAQKFSEQIERCLSEEVRGALGDRLQAAAPFSWDRLFESLSASCADALRSPGT